MSLTAVCSSSSVLRLSGFRRRGLLSLITAIPSSPEAGVYSTDGGSAAAAAAELVVTGVVANDAVGARRSVSHRAADPSEAVGREEQASRTLAALAACIVLFTA